MARNDQQKHHRGQFVFAQPIAILLRFDQPYQFWKWGRDRIAGIANEAIVFEQVDAVLISRNDEDFYDTNGHFAHRKKLTQPFVVDLFVVVKVFATDVEWQLNFIVYAVCQQGLACRRFCSGCVRVKVMFDCDPWK